MQRLKNTGIPVPPRPNGSLFAGALIGTVIMTAAVQAMALGIGVAVNAATLKDG